MVYLFLVIIGFMSFIRIQLKKYFGLDIDWHLVYHLITLILGILVIIKTFIKGKIAFRKIETSFLIIIFSFLFTGFFYINNNIFITYWGIFEYLYIFLLSYFLSFFTPTQKNIKLVYKSFKILVFLMVGVAIYQEVEYLLNKLGVISFMIFHNHPLEAIRLGILRPPSLVGSPTEWGSVALIYFLMELYLNNFKLSTGNIILVLTFFISVTRSLYLCFSSVMFLMFMFKKRNLVGEIVDKLELLRRRKNIGKIKILLFSIGLIILTLLGIYTIYSRNIDFLYSEGHLRGYALWIAKNIENKIIGIGPGMFGSYVSFITKTPYLEKYQSYILSEVERIKTIDSYWIQIFIEMGIIGLLLNILLFLIFYKIMYINFRSINEENKIMKSIAFACIFIPLIYAINGIGFTTFIASYVILTSLLAGIVWGYVRNIKRLQ